MIKAIENLLKPRTTMLGAISQLTIEQLNHIPAGFNNNIIWNLGHMVAAQQGVCYKRAGLELIHIDEDFFNAYKPGSKPEKFLDMAEFEEITGLMRLSLELLEKDMQTDMFNGYTTWTTRYGVDISNINEAVAFLPFHDGLHIGTIGALKKLV